MATEPTTSRAPSLASQVSRAVVWNAVFVPLRMIAEIVATLLKLTVLPLTSYGLLALVSGASNGLGTWIDLGTTRALPKYIPETNRTGGPRAVLRLLFAVLAAQVAVLTLVFAGLIAGYERYIGELQGKVLADGRIPPVEQMTLVQFIDESGWLIMLTILIMLFLGICYDMLMAYLNSFFKQRAWNSVALAAGLLPPLLSATAILISRLTPDPDRSAIIGVLIAMFVAPAIAVALAAWNVYRLWKSDIGSWSDDGPTVLNLSFADALPSGFVRYCAVSYLMTLTDFLASKSFAVFLANDISDVALLWAGASVVGMVLGYLYTPMVGVQVPLFTRVRAGEGGTLLGAYQSLARLQALLLIPGAVGLILLTRPVLTVLTPQYVDAASLVWALVPCLFLESMLTTAHNALIVYEKLRVIVISRLLTLSVVPLLVLLSPLLGVVGVALAFGLARVLAGLWATASGYRLLGLRWPWRFTLRVLLASSVMALLVAGMAALLPDLPLHASIFLRLREAGLLVCVALLGAGAFIAALRATGGLEPQDREQLAKMRLPGRRWLLRVL
ncbi:MAG: polysaccharide biosynthesis C-terminal domain-containing protein [Roseiflexus sp.]|uniref:polysaccharide biosynthesis C-terminal domain-containing protein n=1 Tax=Roseiflexus sp. TaxID=2562120 RepID=UPI0025D1672F|nr:polysaccharide biosynthesis C-terminal domain-containing protein [Roseiflexus sp.]MCL6540664.1 polysaccharide biosynthesis C-terminal domain-containing protein [Roseiflexus sp.]